MLQDKRSDATNSIKTIQDSIKIQSAIYLMGARLPVEDIKVETISRPFDWDTSKPFPTVLPMLKELPDPDAKTDA
jgi:hypothetical protein